MGWLALVLSVIGAAQFWTQLIASVIAIAKRTGHGVPIVGSGMRILFTGSWLAFGLTGAQIDCPVVTYGITGVLAFGSQLISGLRAQSKDEIEHLG